MAKNISKAEVDRLKRAAMAAKARIGRIKEESEQIGEQIQAALLTTGSTFGFAYAMHRFRGADGTAGITVLGVPVDLLTGVALHGLALFGAFGKYRDSMQSLANGALASYGATLGAGVGTRQWQQSRGQLPAPAAASGVSASDLRDLAGAFR